MPPEKRAFLAKYGNNYGYNGQIDHIRRTQFPHLKGAKYLDNTGSSVYQKRQIDSVLRNLEENLYGNTHSVNPSSTRTERAVEEARQMILDWFNVNIADYAVIFTAGATGALKLVGETFPWTHDSEFLYMRSDHNSVLGIREYALERGATFDCTDEADLMSRIKPRNVNPKPGRADTAHLFAFPGECNFSGVKYPLSLIDLFHNGTLGSKKGTYYVLLDAAALVPNAPLDLQAHPADFVALSFYKMFGYPSGLGALIARQDALPVLKKTFFSGGTVATAISDDHFHLWQPDVCTRFEDGTLPFLNIMAIKYGFEVLSDFGMDAIKMHTWSLMDYGYEQLKQLVHKNGQHLVEFYGRHDTHNPDLQGPILNFNLHKPNGSYYGYFEVAEVAARRNIHIRSGCACNPGACYGYLHLDNSFVKKVHQGMSTGGEGKQTCHDHLDVVDGRILGSIRVSIGYMNTWEDIQALVDLLREEFLEAAA